MPTPLALCLEDLDAPLRSQRYLRCVALVGRQPGLRLAASGHVLWQCDAGAACEIWVSADDRLIVYRPADAPPVVLRRAGRCLELPAGKPVVALDQDSLELGERRLRLHVHGRAPQVTAPSPLPERGRSSAARVAAVVAVGAVVAGCERPMEIRDQPPSVEPEPVPTVPIEPEQGATTTTATATTATAESGPFAAPPPSAEPLPESPPPIEVREDPPDMAPIDE